MSKFKEQDRDWNLNKGFGDVLIDNIVDVDYAAKQGDIKVWFNSLRILYRNICGYKKINADTIKSVDKKMQQVKKDLDGLENPARTEEGKAGRMLKIRGIKKELDEINIELVSAMHKAGLIFPIQRQHPKYSGLEM